MLCHVVFNLHYNDTIRHDVAMACHRHDKPFQHVNGPNPRNFLKSLLATSSRQAARMLWASLQQAVPSRDALI